MSNSVGDKSLLGTNKCVYERSENEQAMASQNVFNLTMLQSLLVKYSKNLLCLSVNAIPLGTCEKAKACEYREPETCN